MQALLARIRAAFEDLSPRERTLVAAAGVVLVLAVFVLGVVQPVLSASDRAARRLAAAEQELRSVQELRARHQEMSMRLATVEARIRSGPSGEIFTTLEELARQSAVKVDSMEPRTSPASDDYRETKVQVALKGVTLAQVVNYLHRIETTPQLLSVKSLRLRTRADGSDLLDVTFTVSSFEPIGS
jgi:general secretion pathway protein M